MNQKNPEPDKRFKRIKFVKKFLRYAPRKASLHRYPVLKKFADVAKKRPYLWSFRTSEVTPAFYLGWIIMLTPLPAIVHIALAFLMAIICRANLTILVFLPLLSNTLTFVFWWALAYEAGFLTISLLGTKDITNVAISFANINELVHSGIPTAFRIFLIITLGAIVLGSILGIISSEIYKFFAKKYSSKDKV